MKKAFVVHTTAWSDAHEACSTLEVAQESLAELIAEYISCQEEGIHEHLHHTNADRTELARLSRGLDPMRETLETVKYASPAELDYVYDLGGELFEITPVVGFLVEPCGGNLPKLNTPEFGKVFCRAEAQGE